MKLTAFWDIAPCSLVAVDDVSEVRTSSIITAMNENNFLRNIKLIKGKEISPKICTV
jgi:hypothetical protein